LPSRADLGQVLHRLADRGYPLQGGADHGVSEALYLADPDGNGIEIYIDRPKEKWPWHNGELRMVTDPLDIENLLDQAQGFWDGLSPKTRIGHIHLHVADLHQAQCFYCDTLGFDLMQRFGHSALFLSAGGYHHHIGLNTWAGVGAPPPPPDVVGLRYFTINLSSEQAFAQVVKRLESKGIPFEPSASSGTTPRKLNLHDPSGNGILLSVS
jgi:catechol 2,3-dioxygenase